MNAAIVTIKETKFNFGNSLQNYASKYILEKLGCDADTIFFECDKSWFQKFFVKKLIHKATGYRFSGRKDYWQLEAERMTKFYSFHKHFCPFRFCSNTNELKNRYDYFVIGSDQVWNPNWFRGNSLKKEMYLLTFAKPEQKICMSPSFGVEALPEEWKTFFAEQLNTFPHLSVREKSGADIIKKLTGKDAEVLIDPTLMMTKDEWRTVARKPQRIGINDRYILTYFLGDTSNEKRNIVSKIATKNNLKVVNLLDTDYKDLYIIDPSEFLYMVDNAALILTDSFHACVFSFIFERPFLAFEREGTENYMFSRIDNFLKTFSLERKYIHSNLYNDMFEADYNEGFVNLEIEKNRAFDFLRKSFGSK